MTFQEKMQKFYTAVQASSLFPNDKEILYYQSGNQNDLFSELAIFQAAVEFIQKEYAGKAEQCLDQDQVRYSTLFKFLDYLDRPYTYNTEKTYKQFLMEKMIERVQSNAENMDQQPLVISPLYEIDRQHSNDQLILEKEQELLTNETIRKQYEEIQKQEKSVEEILKKIDPNYIAPCENFFREKAIMTIYYYTIQQQLAKELHLENDNSLVGKLSKFVQCYPREKVQFQSNYTQIVKLFKLLPQDAKKDFAEQLRLFDEKEEYNEDKIVEKLDKLKEGEKTEFLEKIKSII